MPLTVTIHLRITALVPRPLIMIHVKSPFLHQTAASRSFAPVKSSHKRRQEPRDLSARSSCLRSGLSSSNFDFHRCVPSLKHARRFLAPPSGESSSVRAGLRRTAVGGGESRSWDLCGIGFSGARPQLVACCNNSHCIRFT